MTTTFQEASMASIKHKMSIQNDQVKRGHTRDDQATETTKKRKTNHDKEAWNASYEKLVQYKNKHGHCQVPQKYKDDPKLGRWVSSRVLSDHSRRRANCHPSESKNLNPLDSPGAFKSTRVLRPCMALLHGHCWVPIYYPEDPKLAGWAGHQRRLKAQGELLPDREVQLDSLGFTWNTFDSMYERLVEFKNRYGHCEVPLQYQNDPKLGIWVARMRHERNYSRLDFDRIVKLDSIGFSW